SGSGRPRPLDGVHRRNDVGLAQRDSHAGLLTGVRNPGRLISAVAALSAVAAVLFSVLAGWDSPAGWALPAMTLAVAVAERASVRLNVGRQAIIVALHEAFVAVGLVLMPGAWITLAYVLGVGLVQVRTPWVK